MKKFNIKNPLFWIAVASVLPIVFWFLVLPVSARFDGWQSSARSFGQIAALLGTALFSIALILSSRLPILDKIFNGINRAYVIHHTVGALAFIFLLFHPLFLAANIVSISVVSAALFFVPSVNNWQVALGIFGLAVMIAALVLTFYARLKYELWKNTHRFLGLAFFLGGLHMFFIGSDVSQNNLLRVYMLALAAAGLAAYAYRLFGWKFINKPKAGVIQAVKKINDGSFEIEIGLSAGEYLNYKAGQFIFVKFVSKNIPAEWHPFSLSSAPGEKSFSFVAKSLGDFTKKLGALKNGDKVSIDGPYGAFNWQRAKGRRQIWVAGGIGVTPFLSMAGDLKIKNFPVAVDFFYSVKNKPEAIFIEQLDSIARSSGGRFNFTPFYSAESGFLTADFIVSKAENIDSLRIFICGPSGMMTSLRRQFKNLGVLDDNIYSEEFALQ